MFWNSINLTYLSQLGDKDLVSDYLFSSQRESHSVPDMDFFAKPSLGAIKNKFTKIDFNYFNGNSDCSSCPG